VEVYTVTVAEFSLTEAEAEKERRRRGERIQDEARRLSSSLGDFVRAAWPIVWPNTVFVDGWHIDSICDHLVAVTAGEIRRLQIWVPPGSMKSTIVSILWPVWEWTMFPHYRYISGSYDAKLSTDLAVKSRDLLRSGWFQTRWPEIVMKSDHDLKTSYANTEGGVRYATSPGGMGTGFHGDRILIDDPLNAKEIVSDAKLEEASDWHDGTLSTRFTDPKRSAEVIIMQRLHERDLAGHVLGQEDWVVLCLPERYEKKHPFVTPARRKLESGRVLQGDIRKVETELLWPERVGEDENKARQTRLSVHRAVGQLQQRPSAREGAILKRDHWRFFPARWLEDDQLHHLPKFTAIIESWDTAFKDRTHNDYVAGGVWGQIGPDLYLLHSVHDHLSLSKTKAAMRFTHGWVEERWPSVPHRSLIEKSANGVEIIAELRREFRGVTVVRADVSKVARAEAAEPTLEAGNIFVPGMKDAENPAGYDPAHTPAMTQSLIEEASSFPLGEHDDEVDQFTQVVNWTRANTGSAAKMSRPGGAHPVRGALRPVGGRIVGP
jgi:predicted phage terminase large subunit-like protein